MIKHEKVISSDELDLPDDPETTRMATAVVIFCIIGGPIVLTSIMMIAMYAKEIDAFMKSVVVFLYWHPFFTFTLVFYFVIAFGYVAMNKLLKR